MARRYRKKQAGKKGSALSAMLVKEDFSKKIKDLINSAPDLFRTKISLKDLVTPNSKGYSSISI